MRLPNKSLLQIQSELLGRPENKTRSMPNKSHQIQAVRQQLAHSQLCIYQWICLMVKVWRSMLTKRTSLPDKTIQWRWLCFTIRLQATVLTWVATKYINTESRQRLTCSRCRSRERKWLSQSKALWKKWTRLTKEKKFRVNRQLCVIADSFSVERFLMVSITQSYEISEVVSLRYMARRARLKIL